MTNQVIGWRYEQIMSDDDDNDEDERKDIVERDRWPFDGFGLLDLDRMFRNMTRDMMRRPTGFESDSRTPFGEVREDEKAGEISITLEMPGVSKEEIDVRVNEESVEVEANSDTHKYHRSYSFGKRLDPTKTRASFINGILELTLKTDKGRAIKGHRVNIE
jgi:HSP20 family molecular chaperone IbpA